MKKYFTTTLLFLGMVASATTQYPPYSYIDSKITNLDEYNNSAILICYMSDSPADPRYHTMSCSKLKKNQIIKYHLPQIMFMGMIPSIGLIALPSSLYNQSGIQKMLSSYNFTGDIKDDPVASKWIYIPTYYDNKYDWNASKQQYTTKYTESNETRIYSITSVTDNNITLKLDKRIINFKDGTQKRITYKGAEK